MRIKSLHEDLRQFLFALGLEFPVMGELFFVCKPSAQAYEWLTARVAQSHLFDTLNEAIDHATASSGDVILVAPGHTESVAAAAGIVFDVAGLRCIGLGEGSMRPTITFTATASDMDVTGAGTYLKNLLFVSGVDNLTAPIHLAGADITLKDIETRDNVATIHTDDFILTTDACDRLRLLDWVHRAGAGKTGAQTAISLVGGDGVVIIPKYIDGDFATACIENATTASDPLEIFGRASWPAYLRTRNSADVITACKSDTKGRQGPFLNARVKDNAANVTEAFVGADMEFFQPINIVNADGESSLQTNITATVDEV